MSENEPETVEETEPRPFEENDHGGDPDSSEGAEIPTEDLDLAPADSAEHSDHSEDDE